MPTAIKFWTDERLERLHVLVHQGVSSTVIGAELGCSRNAIIGKMLRLGLKSKNPRGITQRLSLSNIQKRGPTVVGSIPAEVAAPDGPIGLVRDFPMGRSTCRYIHGDIGSAWQLCGHPGYPWCNFHKREMFNAAATKRSAEKQREAA